MPRKQHDSRTRYHDRFGTPVPRVGRRPPRAVSSRSRTTNPGAERAKELEIVKGAPVAPDTVLVRAASRPTDESKTTLGNGYLGSRIDEERSEMRYLV